VFKVFYKKISTKRFFLVISVFSLFGGAIDSAHAQAGVSAAVSSQTQQDQQLRTQLKETEQLSQPSPAPEGRQLLAKPLSPDMGQVNILGEEPSQPWFSISVDCQAFYNSNVLYASSIENTFGAWQIITTPEISFAPTIQDETYKMLSPRAGFRYQFFTYAQAEPPKQTYATTGPSALNFDVMNPYLGLGWKVDDDLSFDFSMQGNLYEGNGRDRSSYVNFLNEYPLAWQATWFQSFAEIHSVSITGRASYVFAISPAQSGSPSNNQFSRTDNNLTFSWSTTPMEELNTQMYASFRLAKYTGSGSDQIPGSTFSGGNNAFTESDRLDFQQTYGASVTWSPIEYLSVRAFVSWTKSDTSIPEPVTGQFEAYNAGTGLNLVYRF